MTQEHIDLLFKEICARIPYGVKGINRSSCVSTPKGWKTAFTLEKAIKYRIIKYNWKPCLFPLSNITEEQYKFLQESGILEGCTHTYEYTNSRNKVCFKIKQFKTYSLELIEWFHKNHIDYQGLIEKGLAINATGLGIY